MALSDEDLRRLIAATPDDTSHDQDTEIGFTLISFLVRSAIRLGLNHPDHYAPDLDPETAIQTAVRRNVEPRYPHLTKRIIDRYCNLPDSPIRQVVFSFNLLEEELEPAIQRMMEVTPPGLVTRDDLARINETGTGYKQIYLRISISTFLNKNGRNPELVPRIIQFLDPDDLNLTAEDVDEYCELATMEFQPGKLGNESTASRLTTMPVSQRQETAAALGTDLATQKPVTLSDSHRPRHISIIGKTGYGKTTLLKHLILEDIRTGTSAIVIDPHGDLSWDIISLASPEQRERITLLEVWPERPFRLNLLECPDPTQLDRTVDDILTLFQRLFDSGTTHLGHRLHRYLGNALRTLIPNHRSLADVQRLFFDEAFRAEMLGNIQNRKVHEFWHMFEQMPPRERIEQLESTINRLDEFLSAETAHAMVSATETTVPLTNILSNDGQLLLIRIPIGELGEQQARFYGSMFLSLLTDRLFARAKLAESTRHRLHLYLDEYGWFATSTTAALLQQARKYNLGATIAFQTLADLPDEKNKQAALQVGTFIVLRLVGENADELVSQFPVIPRKEMISESVGYKAIERISPNPFEHLLTHPHTNSEATKAAQAFFRPLSEKIQDAQRSRGMSDIFQPIFTAERGSEAIQRIDQLLITVMERGTTQSPDYLSSELAAIFTLLSSYYKFPYAYESGGIGRNIFERPAVQDELNKVIQAFILNRSFTVDQSSQLWRVLLAQLNQLKDQKHTDAVRQLERAFPRLISDIPNFLTLIEVLTYEPINVPTGQQHEEFRERTHIQTHADARLELAGILANLREYTAYYQMGSDTGQVALTEPSQPGYTDEEAIKAVRERSKSLYGVPIAEDPPTTSLPAVTPSPRISRRPPTQN